MKNHCNQKLLKSVHLWTDFSKTKQEYFVSGPFRCFSECLWDMNFWCILLVCTLNNSDRRMIMTEFLIEIDYRKVASSRLVYYSIFDHFWGATNQDVLLSETCYYCHVQQSIKWWVHKRLHELVSIFVNYMVHIMYFHK